ncbi:MAG: hypothetical protein CBC29_06745 [Methylococcaceae bacterium TMED69]|nr:MAG: hypothetical protein CBC29_06745 [Methylococcaceae bacterium TMED69]|tara:strand:- start:421 stop:858 length:438 start_codon:yes stop_codon:yes gene_type:complete
MKISKRRLKRIIAEECGAMGLTADLGHEAVSQALPALSESEAPEAELVTEMQGALSGLQMVVESLNSAATLCVDCVQEVAAQAPVLQAVATQAQALQEMLEAQVQVVSESTDHDAGHEAMLPEPLKQIQAEAIRRSRRLRLNRRK